MHYNDKKGKDDKNFLGLTTMWVYVFGPLTGAVFSGLLSHFSKDTIEELDKHAPKPE